jgi:hypothetical protein
MSKEGEGRSGMIAVCAGMEVRFKRQVASTPPEFLHPQTTTL